MIGSDEITAAFTAIAPDVMTGDPLPALRNRGVEPDALAPIGGTLVQIFAQQRTPPEDAVPAAFVIGVILGLELALHDPAITGIPGPSHTCTECGQAITNGPGGHEYGHLEDCPIVT